MKPMNLPAKLSTAVALALVAATASPASIFPKKKDAAQNDTRKLTPAQSALVDKAIGREAVVIKTLRERSPIVETYIQNMRPDPVMGETVDSDVHFLARVDFNKVIGQSTFASGSGDQKAGGGFKHSLGYITGLSKSLHLSYNDAGFVRMIVIDSAGFDRQHYNFTYLRNEFLGTVPTMVFDVAPIKKVPGRFFGRIWVERNGGNIVRYDGDLAGAERDNMNEYFHFNSVRTNVEEGLWLPYQSYIEETDPKSPSHSLRFKAINQIWGYSLKIPAKDSDQTDLEVQGATDESQQNGDLSPLAAQRQWIQQAEDNVIDRLYSAGLIDAPSDFDKVLAQLANNILAYNQIPIDRPIRVRTLLTEPLESVAVGNTILISKGLVDTSAVVTADGAQQMGNLNALLAFQVAQIVLGHHIDTKYAFSDRLLFPPQSAFEKLPLHHTDADDAESAKKTMELLNAKELVDGEQYFGLYLQQLQAREKGLKALTDPQLGDSLMKPDGTFWLQALVSKAPKLDNTDLKQQAAEPLNSFLRIDPWTDQVIRLNAAPAPLLSPRDKLPFEITPISVNLTYWKAPVDPNAAPAATATPDTTTTASPAPANTPQ
ncbi:MAG: hypothetical protein HIU91_04765 [Acidobacteria bacterium]|nr:hypothetical protein [Acidobacteriota bacterium]